jgi:hypothetical protein
MRNCRPFALALVAFLAATASSARAHESAGQQCSVAKLKAAVKKAAAQGLCEEKAIKNAVAVDSGCLAAAGARFSLAFQEAEAPGGCTTTGDAGDVENQVDAFVVDLVNALGTTGTTTKCNVDKLKAALKLAAGRVRCDEKAIIMGAPVDGTCFNRAGNHPAKLFEKAGFECPDAGLGAVETMATVVSKFVPHLGRSLAPTATLPCEPPLRIWASPMNFGFGGIGGVAADASGNVFVVDFGFSDVQKFDNDGNFLTTWGSDGSGTGQFSNPTLDAVDSSGNVFVADGDGLNNRIEKFDNGGTFLTTWGSMGSAAGQFNSPEGIAVDASDTVIVTDTGNARIERFDSSGTLLTICGGSDISGGPAGGFGFPSSVTVDANGNIFVADFPHILKFDNDP